SLIGGTVQGSVERGVSFARTVTLARDGQGEVQSWARGRSVRRPARGVPARDGGGEEAPDRPRSAGPWGLRQPARHPEAGLDRGAAGRSQSRLARARVRQLSAEGQARGPDRGHAGSRAEDPPPTLAPREAAAHL